MAVDFPASPTNGQSFTAPTGVVYVFGNSAWRSAAAASGPWVQRSGDTMIGALALAGDPATALQAATKQYVDVSPRSYRNILGRNGGFEVWQRSSGDSGTAGFNMPASTPQYTADGWWAACGPNQAMQVLQAAPLMVGSRWAAYVARAQGQTGTTTMSFEYALDADEIALMRGSIVTLSAFIIKAANWSPAGGILKCYLLTGTGPPKRAAAGFTNQGQPIYVDYPVPVPVTRFVATTAAVIPNNVTQASVYFQWLPVGTAGVNDAFVIDDVQLEVGSVATAFERRPFEQELFACKRHFQKSFDYAVAPVVGNGNGNYLTDTQSVGASLMTYGASRQLSPTMRVTPTIALYGVAAAPAQMRCINNNADCSNTNVWLTSPGSLILYYATAAASAPGWTNIIHYTADAGI
jgi:hypothetical protein